MTLGRMCIPEDATGVRGNSNCRRLENNRPILKEHFLVHFQNFVIMISIFTCASVSLLCIFSSYSFSISSCHCFCPFLYLFLLTSSYLSSFTVIFIHHLFQFLPSRTPLFFLSSPFHFFFFFYSYFPLWLSLFVLFSTYLFHYFASLVIADHAPAENNWPTWA